MTVIYSVNALVGVIYPVIILKGKFYPAFWYENSLLPKACIIATFDNN